MKITSSESKEKLERSGKELIISLGLKAKVRPHNYKKSRYSIKNVSMKDRLKIIRKFDKLPYESYDKKRPKHEPTDSYFYLARQLAKSMMRYDALNSHGYPFKTKMAYPSLQVCSTDEDESSVPKTWMNQKASSSTKLYCRAVPRMRTIYVLRRKTNQNALLRRKNM